MGRSGMTTGRAYPMETVMKKFLLVSAAALSLSAASAPAQAVPNQWMLCTQGFCFTTYYTSSSLCQAAGNAIVNVGFASPPPYSCIPSNGGGAGAVVGGGSPDNTKTSP